MKLRVLQALCICALAVAWVACGAGHPTITHMTVSPATATALLSPPSDVQYTATATFSNNSSRELTLADGLSWSTSNTSIATISTGGSASCKAVGTVTVTATAPANLNLTVNNGVNNTSQNVTATAELKCLVM